MRSFCGAVCHQFKFAPSCAQIHSRADQKACLLGYEHMILIVHNRMGERGALTNHDLPSHPACMQCGGTLSVYTDIIVCTCVGEYALKQGRFHTHQHTQTYTHRKRQTDRPTDRQTETETETGRQANKYIEHAHEHTSTNTYTLHWGHSFIPLGYSCGVPLAFFFALGVFCFFLFTAGAPFAFALCVHDVG